MTYYYRLSEPWREIHKLPSSLQKRLQTKSNSAAKDDQNNQKKSSF